MKEIFFLLLFLMYLNVRMEMREMFNCMHYSFFFLTVLCMQGC